MAKIWAQCLVLLLLGACSKLYSPNPSQRDSFVPIEIVYQDTATADETFVYEGTDPAEEVTVAEGADENVEEDIIEVAAEEYGIDIHIDEVSGEKKEDTAALPDEKVLCKPNDPGCKCESDGDCDQSFDTLCGQNRCNKALGACIITPTAKDGTGCDDGNPCTVDDKCSKGFCVGEPNSCDDGNSCTKDICESSQGCLHVPTDGVCEDGNLCTGPDYCENGKCKSGPEILCDDKNPCTKDFCEPSSGCQHTDISGSCDDGNVCTLGDHCEHGLCVFQSLLGCDDGNVCTLDYCDPRTGCVNEPIASSCDDGDPCTQGDYCENGVCVPGPLKVCFYCGDKVCNEPTEDCKSCPQDCGQCPPDCELGPVVGCGATIQGSSAGKTNAMNSYFSLACLVPVNLSGPEMVMPFKTDDSVHTLVSVSAGLSTVWVLVLTENCNPYSCVAQGLGLFGVPAETIFNPTPTKTYYITVDSSSNTGLAFTLQTQCFEAACADGQDNDQDGLVDCDDPDCGGTALTCGATVKSKIGRFSHVGGYSPACGNHAGGYDDAVFNLVLDAPKTVRVTVTPSAEDDLDVYVTEGGCTGASCIAFGASSSTSGEQVTFSGQTGKYFIVVEEASASSESTGDFQVKVECL